MNMEAIRSELIGWRRVADLTSETRDSIGFRRISTRQGDCLQLGSDLFDITSEQRTGLHEALIETFELSLNDVERMHDYAEQQVRALGRQLLEEATMAIIPGTEVEA